MNTYRVDRVNSRVVPCGMNSIRYLGDNAKEAHKVFDQLEPGLDSWNQPNLAYGVISLSGMARITSSKGRKD